jgi:hypothetical protein
MFLQRKVFLSSVAERIYMEGVAAVRLNIFIRMIISGIDLVRVVYGSRKDLLSIAQIC